MPDSERRVGKEVTRQRKDRQVQRNQSQHCDLNLANVSLIKQRCLSIDLCDNTGNLPISFFLAQEKYLPEGSLEVLR